MATHEIIIKRPPIEGNTDGISPPPSRGIATQRGESVISGGNASAVQSAAAKVASQALQSVSQVYVAQKTTEISVLAGSTQYAQRQAAINAAISAGVNLASGAIQGAGLASMFGLAGGPAALVGLALSAASTVITGLTDYVQAKNQIAINYKAEEQELDYMRSRAGPWYNGSR